MYLHLPSYDDFFDVCIHHPCQNEKDDEQEDENLKEKKSSLGNE